jgi:hypothetical protein
LLYLLREATLAGRYSTLFWSIAWRISLRTADTVRIDAPVLCGLAGCSIDGPDYAIAASTASAN